MITPMDPVIAKATLEQLLLELRTVKLGDIMHVDILANTHKFEIPLTIDFKMQGIDPFHLQTFHVDRRQVSYGPREDYYKEGRGRFMLSINVDDDGVYFHDLEVLAKSELEYAHNCLPLVAALAWQFRTESSYEAYLYFVPDDMVCLSKFGEIVDVLTDLPQETYYRWAHDPPGSMFKGDIIATSDHPAMKILAAIEEKYVEFSEIAESLLRRAKDLV